MMPARYAGWCGLCGQSIDVGELIAKDGDGRWQHHRCIEEREEVRAEQERSADAARREVCRRQFELQRREALRVPAPAREALSAVDRRFAQLLGERVQPASAGFCAAVYRGSDERAFVARCRRCGGLAADHMRKKAS
jgi:hypothetical protein